MHQVEYATEQDAPGLAKINTLSFTDRLLLGELFPGASQPVLQDYKSKYAMKHFASPETHVLKVTDPTDNEIIGYSRWHIPAAIREPYVPELSEMAKLAAQDPLAFAPHPMNDKLMTGFRTLLEKGRKRNTTDKDIILDLLATMPSHQGRGVGSALLRWGTSQADAWQARIYLEATPEGYPLYIKHGWKPVEEITLDFSQYGSQGQESFIIMMRDPIRR